MSSSGPGIFDDDLAADVRDLYRTSLLDKVPDDEATRQSIEGWAGLGPDEEPVFWLALAAAQFQVGRLDQRVRDRAVEVIDSGRDLVRWHEAGPDFAADRAAASRRVRAARALPEAQAGVIERLRLRRPSSDRAVASRSADGVPYSVVRSVPRPRSMRPKMHPCRRTSRGCPRPGRGEGTRAEGVAHDEGRRRQANRGP